MAVLLEVLHLHETALLVLQGLQDLTATSLLQQTILLVTTCLLSNDLLLLAVSATVLLLPPATELVYQIPTMTDLLPLKMATLLTLLLRMGDLTLLHLSNALLYHLLLDLTRLVFLSTILTQIAMDLPLRFRDVLL
jgi:hypothetical protein